MQDTQYTIIDIIAKIHTHSPLVSQQLSLLLNVIGGCYAIPLKQTYLWTQYCGRSRISGIFLYNAFVVKIAITHEQDNYSNAAG